MQCPTSTLPNETTLSKHTCLRTTCIGTCQAGKIARTKKNVQLTVDLIPVISVPRIPATRKETEQIITNHESQTGKRMRCPASIYIYSEAKDIPKQAKQPMCYTTVSRVSALQGKITGLNKRPSTRTTSLIRRPGVLLHCRTLPWPQQTPPSGYIP